MGELLWLRVAAAFLVDASLAALCGLTLARSWLASTGSAASNVTPHDMEVFSQISAGMKLFSALLVTMPLVQFLLLAIDFCGQPSLRVVVHSLPDVAATHPGGASLALCGCGIFLCAAVRVRSEKASLPFCGLLLAGCLVLHAFIGHAAVDGAFSLNELLQVIHLFSITLWSGGVLAAGLLVIPRLSARLVAKEVWEDGDAIPLHRYLSRLSAVSTWAVGFVVLSGILKGYRATAGSLTMIRDSQWGHVLLVKSALVAVTIVLGARNRWLLSFAARWNRSSLRSAVVTLRAESICMVAVLFLSAWLANSPPPME